MKLYGSLILGEQKYKTVEVGTQTWMAENLNTSTSGSYCPAKQEINCNTCGGLYNWKTATANANSSNSDPSNVQGICPSGWHLPSSAEWTKLTNFISANEGTKPDDFGFKASLCGYFNLGDNVSPNYGTIGYWWTATGNSESAFNWQIASNGTNFIAGSIHPNHFLSVRCVKNTGS